LPPKVKLFVNALKAGIDERSKAGSRASRKLTKTVTKEVVE
jgi:hypothetical protein